MTTEDDASARELCITRDLSAPRALIWEALTDPAHLARWWGPTGFATETHAHDLRPGGPWRLTMHGPDGRAYANHAVFDAVEPPHRLALRYLEGEGTEAVHHTTEITLAELGPSRTRLTLRMRFPTAEARAMAVERVGAVEGGQQTLGRLATLLDVLQGAPPVDPCAFVIRRVLAAPPPRVWLAWTDAAHLARWFHPASWTLFAAELDLRVGGTFFYGFRGPEVPDTWALWTFTEVEAPRRLRFEQSFADAQRRVAASPFGGPWPDRVDTTVTMEPHAGIGRGTVLTLTIAPLDATDDERAAFRTAHGSMQTGWAQTLDSLARDLADPSTALAG